MNKLIIVLDGLVTCGVLFAIINPEYDILIVMGIGYVMGKVLAIIT